MCGWGNRRFAPYLMVRYIDFWYNYANETSCMWRSNNGSLKKMNDMLLNGKQIKGRMCRMCAQAFTRLNQRGICPKLFCKTKSNARPNAKRKRMKRNDRANEPVRAGHRADDNMDSDMDDDEDYCEDETDDDYYYEDETDDDNDDYWEDETDESISVTSEMSERSSGNTRSDVESVIGVSANTDGVLSCSLCRKRPPSPLKPRPRHPSPCRSNRGRAVSR